MDGEINIELPITREDGAVFLLEAYLSGANHSFYYYYYYSKKKKVAAQNYCIQRGFIISSYQEPKLLQCRVSSLTGGNRSVIVCFSSS